MKKTTFFTFTMLFLAFSSAEKGRAPTCKVAGQCDGTTHGFGKALSYEECLGDCKADSLCNWFTYFSDKSSCIRFIDCTLNMTCDNCLSGQRECEEEVVDRVCFEPGICNGHYVSDEIALNSAQCLELCKANLACKWFSYLPFEEECLLTSDCTSVDTTCSECVRGQRECTKDEKVANKLVILGGEGGVYQQVEVIDFALNASCKVPVQPSSLSYAGVATFMNAQIYLCGTSGLNCEVYDNKTDSWSSPFSLQADRSYAKALMLSEDEWWITTGYSNYASTEICRPSGCSYHVDMPFSSYTHSLVKVTTDNIFVYYSGNAWMFHNSTQTFDILPDSIEDRTNAQAGLIVYPDGRRQVIVAGGDGLRSTEIYDLEHPDQFWALGPELPDVISSGFVLQLENTFLIIGGKDDEDNPRDEMIIYDIEQEDWVIIDYTLANARYNFAATMIPDGYLQCF